MKHFTVVSLIKQFVAQSTKSKNYKGEEVGFHTSAEIFQVLTNHIKDIVLCGIEKAKADNRRTLMARDIISALEDFNTEQVYELKSKIENLEYRLLAYTNNRTDQHLASGNKIDVAEKV